MPSIGPQLPPHLQDRKRSHAEADDNSSSDSSTGPALPSRSEKETSPASPKRIRVVGPAPPPAPLDERPPLDPPANDDDESESDDDDDFGPSLPSASDSVARSSIASVKTHVSASASATKRDEWMTIAPTNGDWSSRVDPTKLKNRKFNTGKGAKAPPRAGASGDASWHETPEQKQERLKREVLGIKDASESSATSRPGAAPNAQDDATARRLKEYKVRPTPSNGCPLS